MSKINIKSESKLKRLLIIPLRALRSFRDLYIRGMIGCADSVQCNNIALIYPSSAHHYYSQRSSTANCTASLAGRKMSNDDEDLRELISVAVLGKDRSLSLQGNGGKAVEGVSRSNSVMAIGRINEEEEGVCTPKHLLNDLLQNLENYVERHSSQSTAHSSQSTAHSIERL